MNLGTCNANESCTWRTNSPQSNDVTWIWPSAGESSDTTVNTVSTSCGCNGSAASPPIGMVVIVASPSVASTPAASTPVAVSGAATPLAFGSSCASSSAASRSGVVSEEGPAPPSPAVATKIPGSTSSSLCFFFISAFSASALRFCAATGFVPYFSSCACFSSFVAPSNK